MFKLFFGLIIVTNLLSSCASQEQKSLNVINKILIDCSKKYSVKQGETLRYLARTCGITLQTLAEINQLQPPYYLSKNHIIYFHKQQDMVFSPVKSRVTNTNLLKPRPKPKPKNNVSGITLNLERSAKKVPNNIKWIMPVDLPIKRNFSKKHQGITFDNVPGKSVYAIANGTVVHSGNKMISHGKLIILKHKNNFYSSYTQNQELLVKDGQQVHIGDVIAITGKKPFKLEMRKQATPVDPLIYIK